MSRITKVLVLIVCLFVGYFSLTQGLAVGPPQAATTVVARNVFNEAADSSVVVHLPAHGCHGTGVTIATPAGQYVLTAAHVVEDARRVEKVKDRAGRVTNTKVFFETVKIIRHDYTEDKLTKTTTVDADVVRYSNKLLGHDLALLAPRTNIALRSVTFDISFKPLGTPTVHCGTFRAISYNKSVTMGTISGFDRHMPNTEFGYFNQTTATTFGGSSGGGIFDYRTGKVLGILTRGFGESVSLYIPSKRVNQWAELNHVQFILNSKLPSRSPAELLSEQIEDFPAPVISSPSPFSFLPFNY